jgi:uncharacterized protein involved in response to NO
VKIDEPRQADNIAPLWRLAFRPGFLFAAAFAVLAVSRWLLWTYTPAHWGAQLSPHWWHAHEMIFGFAMPVVAGFLLSAVATWTGLPGSRGMPLKVLFGLWFSARLILWLLPGALTVAWLAEMLFIALLMYELGSRVWALRQRRNYLFLPVLLILALLSSLSYYNVDNALLSTRLHYGALWMICVLVVIIGGRVIPLFTANPLGLKIKPLPAWFDYTAIASIALVGLFVALWPTRPDTLWLSVLCYAGFAIHLFRLWHWQGWKTTGIPLLWSMHLSYLCIPLSLLALALAADNPAAVKNIMHLLAIGTVGGMILTMMSRVSLGHTGRPLTTPGGLPSAFLIILAAGLIRAFLPIIEPSLTLLAWRISAVAWIIAFAIFAWRYLPILTAARVDGKPG